MIYIVLYWLVAGHATYMVCNPGVRSSMVEKIVGYVLCQIVGGLFVPAKAMAKVIE